jgi:hypothetical protein
LTTNSGKAKKFVRKVRYEESFAVGNEPWMSERITYLDGINFAARSVYFLKKQIKRKDADIVSIDQPCRVGKRPQPLLSGAMQGKGRATLETLNLPQISQLHRFNRGGASTYRLF